MIGNKKSFLDDNLNSFFFFIWRPLFHNHEEMFVFETSKPHPGRYDVVEEFFKDDDSDFVDLIQN